MPKSTVRLSSDGIEKVKLAIQEKKHTLADLAEKANISQRTAHRFLQGEFVPLNSAEAILKSLDLHDLDILLEQKFDPEEVVHNVQVATIGGTHTQFGKTIPIHQINTAVQELSEASTDEIQVIASAQLKILDSYHREVLMQAKSSFRWALIISGAGFVFGLWTNSKMIREY